MVLEPTPSQTVGPYFTIGLGVPQNELVADDDPRAVRITGRVLDGAGIAVPDALVEIWQATAGWGRCATDADGRYAFVATRPGPIAMLVFARGLLKPVLTRISFPGETGGDRVLAAIEDASLRQTLVAVEADGGLQFDVRLQGDDQTAFFAVN